MLEAMSKITVIIPVFNQVHFTKRCFSSLVEGAKQPQEIIVIDNHSTDDTPQYLREFETWASQKGWRVQIITNSENRGVAAAWNQALKVTSSPFIAIANNDTWVMPGWDEVLLRRMKELDASMLGVQYDETPFDEKETPERARKFVERNKGKFSGEWSSILMFFDRRVFEKLGPFDERYFVCYEDRDMRERMERANLKYYKIADCYIWHHSKGTRDAGKLKPRYEEESLAKFIEKWNFDPRTEESRRGYRYRRKWTLLKNRFGFFCLLLLLGLGTRASAGGPEYPREIPFQVVDVTVPHDQRDTFVIRSTDQWRDKWSAWWSETNYCPRVYGGERPAELDLAGNDLLVVTGGQFNSGGHTFRITKVSEEREKIYAFVEEVHPGFKCATTAAFDCPSSVVLIPKTMKPVEFVFDKSIRNCQ